MLDLPPCWFIAALSEFASEVYKHTGVKKAIARVSVSNEYGMRIGIVPGTSMDIHTAVGYVEVYCEKTPRSYGTFPVLCPGVRPGAYSK